jgi:hypothetical protein
MILQTQQTITKISFGIIDFQYKLKSVMHGLIIARPLYNSLLIKIGGIQSVAYILVHRSNQPNTVSYHIILLRALSTQ